MQFLVGQNLSCSYASQSAIIIPVRWPPTKNPERTKDGHRDRTSKTEGCKSSGCIGSDGQAVGPKQARSRRSVHRSRGIGGESTSRVHARERAGVFVREVAFMFDSIHRHIMAGYAVSIDFTKQGWRQ